MNTLYKYIASALFLTLPGASFAQVNDLASNHGSHAYITSKQYRQGEVLVKFKAGSGVNVRRRMNGKGVTTEISSVDKALSNLGVKSLESLMPLSGNKVERRKMKAYNGSEIKDTDLSQLYLVNFEETRSTTVDAAVKSLAGLDEVEYAEPNYIVYTMDDGDYTSDPMFGEQSYLNAVNMPALWATSTSNVLGHRPVIAIIDTGVDITHPDLADNIWTNNAESAGEEAIDDDNNGFKDDIHGWDFVNQTGRIGDYNGHGTHCAGIAAAVGGNGKGISGANPNALIMPITVMQSNGQGDMATIIKGIDYAVANGADVISMSIGGYVHSMAQEQALAKAYSKCVIVAAAGNDCLPISNSVRCRYCGFYGMPCYPAAFPFVLGVQAGDAIGSFSNWDDDGPVFSKYNEEKLYNYEVSAPGVSMYSTYPGGGYKKLSGTSMACPLVAGVVSKLVETKEYLSKEILFGDLTQTSNGYIDALTAYNMSDEFRNPTLYCVSVDYDDPDGDKDKRIDAGEIVEFYPTIRNDWGETYGDVTVSIGVAENEDPTLIEEFIQNDVKLGCSLSSYAKARCMNPIKIKFRDDIADGRIIRLLVKATCMNISEDMEYEFAVKAENGIELSGTQRENITLYPGVQYIVTRNWGIPKDVVVTVKAGTTIKIHDGVGISNYGYINFEGDSNNMITITKGDNDIGQIGGFLNDNANYVNFNNVIFDNLSGITFDGHTYEHCIIRNCTINTSNYFSSRGTFRDCDIYNNDIHGLLWGHLSAGASFIGCNIHKNEFTHPDSGGWGSVSQFKQSNYIGNNITSRAPSTPGVKDLVESNCYGNLYDALGGFYSIVYNTTEPEIAYLSECYLGTSNEDVANESILDEVDNVGWGHVDLWKMSKSANIDAPGCVDYIEMDDVDPQDAPEDLLPLGVGKHKVTVGFNRAMNQSVAPSISMGVRPPYTQKLIAEDGRWEDPYTYTSYITIDGKSATDGTNRIRVMDYQQKNSDFPMPDEHYRYNVLVSAAGSMSTGMFAEAGLGKVKLTWQTAEEDFDDIIGYNIYRFTRNEAGENSDSIIINSELIDSSEEEYTDYDVVPGTTYYYMIKEMGTDLTQYDISNTVVATPLTSQKGDANGSLTVDIADVMTEIAYLSNENPEPFIYEAADVNSDGYIDILDVVGTLRIITSPEVETEAVDEDEIAYCYVKDGKLVVNTPVAIGGVQIGIKSGKESLVVAGESLASMEKLDAQINDNNRIYLAYSMSGSVVAAGEQELVSIQGDELNIDNIVLSTPRGANIKVVFEDPTGISDIVHSANMMQKGIYDLTGRKLNSLPKHGVFIVDGKKRVY